MKFSIQPFYIAVSHPSVPSLSSRANVVNTSILVLDAAIYVKEGVICCSLVRLRTSSLSFCLLQDRLKHCGGCR